MGNLTSIRGGVLLNSNADMDGKSAAAGRKPRVPFSEEFNDTSCIPIEPIARLELLVNRILRIRMQQYDCGSRGQDCCGPTAVRRAHPPPPTRASAPAP